MTASNENELAFGKLRSWAARVLSLAHILSVCGMAYQVPPRADHFALVNFLVWLSPAVVPILVRRSCVLTLIFAVPILVIFCARMFFVWQFYSIGINSVGQKGDGAWLGTTVLGALSIGIIALWFLIRTLTWIVNFFFNKSHEVSK